jgi:hypothetical protein
MVAMLVDATVDLMAGLLDKMLVAHLDTPLVG